MATEIRSGDVEVSRAVVSEGLPKGRPPKYEPMIWMADRLPALLHRPGDEGYDPQHDGVPYTDWVIYPDADEHGRREPVVRAETRFTLRRKFGWGSEFHRQEGYWFEVLLGDRIVKQSQGPKKTKTAHGALYVRKVQQPFEET